MEANAFAEACTKDLASHISANNEYNFRRACFHGQLDLVKWLYAQNPDIAISANNDYSFRWACANGHLDLGKWLYAQNPDIHISAIDEFAFRWACYNGHFAVVKWLYGIHPDINISAKNNFALRQACVKGNQELATWLVRHDKIPLLTEIFFLKNTELCCICTLDDTDIITNCKHVFCTACISKWYNLSHTCPICRTAINLFNKIIRG